MQVGFIGSGTMASALARGWGDPVLCSDGGSGRAALLAEELAYWALVAEAWTDAAIRHGMLASQAATLVTETMAGTAAVLTQTDTLALRRGVTSPGGSTARGLDALERGGVRAAVSGAMDAVVSA